MAIDGYIPGSLDSQTDFSSIDIHDGDADLIADVDFFPQLSAKDKHTRHPPEAMPSQGACLGKHTPVPWGKRV